jgi:hypothetical protein
MPTCIDARVRRLGSKNTRATDLPSSGLSAEGLRFDSNAADMSRSSVAVSTSEVLRKLRIEHLDEMVNRREGRVQRRQQSEHGRVT